MPNALPRTLEVYFAAQNRHDAQGMTACFAPDADVQDEGRTYVGRDAILEWKKHTITKYGISIEPLGNSGDGKALTVVARVTGNFPGSPANLTYKFDLGADDLIRGLDVR